MPTGTVQVPVLMSPAQKRRLARKAKDAKLTMGELLRQGGEQFAPSRDEDLLHQVARQVAKTTQRAIHSIDKTLALIAQSEARIQALNKARKKH